MKTPRDHQADASTALQRDLGVLGLCAHIFNCTVGGGIFRLPAAIFVIVGTTAPLVYLICGGLMIMVGYCFGSVGQKVLKTGGPYAYIKLSFGSLPAYLSATLTALLMFFAMASVLDALLDHLPVPRLPGLLALSLVMVLATLRPIKQSGQIILALSMVKLIPLMAFVGMALVYSNRFELIALTSISAVDFSSLSRAAMLLMFAFMGLESALVPSGEIRNPKTTVPLALMFAISAVVVLYVLIQGATQLALGAKLYQHQTAPLVMAARAYCGNFGATLMALGALVSMLGFLISMMLSSSRLLYALACDAILPKCLATVDAKRDVPRNAVFVAGAIVALLVCWGTFESLAILANASALLLYIGCILSAIRQYSLSSNGPVKPASLVFYSVAALALLTMTAMLSAVTSKEWLTLSLVMLVAAVVYGLRTGLKTKAPSC